MKYAEWLFKLRTNLGAVDQRYQLEPTTTEASSTPRLNATLSSEASCLTTQMYYILVMTTTGSALNKCPNAGENEGFEAWRQFVMEWEPKPVGLLMNVLYYQLKDDVPTKVGSVRKTRARESIVGDFTTTPRPVRQCWGWRTCGSKRTPSGTARGSRAGHRLERTSSRSREHNSTQTARTEAKARTLKTEAWARIQRTSESGRPVKVLLLSQDRSRKASMCNETERPSRY